AELCAKGIPVYWIGLPGANRDNLEVFAEAGCTDNPGAPHRYYWATNAEEVSSAISSIAWAHISCRYALDTTPPDPNRLWVQIQDDTDPANPVLSAVP